MGKEGYIEIPIEKETYELAEECAEKLGVSVDKFVEDAVIEMLEKKEA